MVKQKGKWNDSFQEVHCNSCRRITRHHLVRSSIQEGSDIEEFDDGDEYEFRWEARFSMFECCGCKDVVLRRIFLLSENPEPEITYFPPPIFRHPPAWRHKLPRELRDILEEIYRALDANCGALSIMGARTLIDLLMSKSVGDRGSFPAKLDAFQAKGVITAQSRKVLETALEAGNAAAHRGFAPKTSDIHAVMDIVENLLQSVYVFDQVAKNLRKVTPHRKRKRAKAKP